MADFEQFVRVLSKILKFSPHFYKFITFFVVVCSYKSPRPRTLSGEFILP
ncbi:unnamed protein product [Moneuplotes crassus]|uniref:Uncharacterized protein n=1 Tax=Euplotes crassus TaxID=5936 RepID=A0AAD1UF78_EUPCR|nr:unnamed protein product [Moneuplotes crassus]